MILSAYMRESSEWLIGHADNLSTIATSHSLTSARYVSSRRKRNMSIFGAAAALSLIRGSSAGTLDPVLLHFLIHNCDLHSIHPGIVGEYHPALKQTIADWMALGPKGDPTPFQAHFAIFRDVQVSI